MQFLPWAVSLFMLGGTAWANPDPIVPKLRIQESAGSTNSVGAVLVTATDRPLYLIVLLHGIGGGKAYFQSEEFSLEMNTYLAKGFAFLIPEGQNSVPVGVSGAQKPYRAWNAAAADKPKSNDCCFDLFTRHQNFQRKAQHLRLLKSPSSPNHLRQLEGLIKRKAKFLGIPNDNIGLLGISNGAIMAYRLHCSGKPGSFKAMVSLQGTLTGDGACGLGAAEHVLHIHGDADEIVPYAGGMSKIAPLYPAYHFDRPPLVSFALIAKSAGCVFNTSDYSSKIAIRSSQSRFNANCPSSRRDLSFLVYHGAGHEFRMSMFTEGLAFIASHMVKPH